mmetsp:Transcript_33730/g.60709  ORF Transcript_33730/g.60709 Transcript_33730/m.60709 type:complete len:269 (+) Transcript_33730:186-992(+)
MTLSQREPCTIEPYFHPSLPHNLRLEVDNTGELFTVQRSSTHKSSINIRLAHQLVDTIGCHAASVQDSDTVRSLLIINIRKDCPAFGMHILGNFWGGNLSSSNSPNRLIRNNHSIQILLLDPLQALLQLHGTNTPGQILFEFLQALTDTKHDGHSLIDDFESLCIDVIVGFAEDYTTFGMSRECPLDTDGFEHGGGNGTCVGSVNLRADSLGTNTKFTAHGTHSRLNKHIWDEQRHIGIGTILRNRRGNFRGESQCLSFRLRIQLPVP